MIIEKEKYLEKKLAARMLKIGGWSIKLLPTFVSGIPDRLCLFPNGKVRFVEVKETNKKPSPIQRVIHKKLLKVGFPVLVLDCSEQIETLINENK